MYSSHEEEEQQKEDYHNHVTNNTNTNNQTTTTTTTTSSWLMSLFTPSSSTTAKNNNQVNSSITNTNTNHGNEEETPIDQCSICLESYKMIKNNNNNNDKEEENVTIGHTCAHIFHTKCILQWMTAKHDFCPICRQYLFDVRKFKDVAQEQLSKERFDEIVKKDDPILVAMYMEHFDRDDMSNIHNIHDDDHHSTHNHDDDNHNDDHHNDDEDVDVNAVNETSNRSGNEQISNNNMKKKMMMKEVVIIKMQPMILLQVVVVPLMVPLNNKEHEINCKPTHNIFEASCMRCCTTSIVVHKNTNF